MLSNRRLTPSHHSPQYQLHPHEPHKANPVSSIRYLSKAHSLVSGAFRGSGHGRARLTLLATAQTATASRSAPSIRRCFAMAQSIRKTRRRDSLPSPHQFSLIPLSYLILRGGQGLERPNCFCDVLTGCVRDHTSVRGDIIERDVRVNRVAVDDEKRGHSCSFFKDRVSIAHRYLLPMVFVVGMREWQELGASALPTGPAGFALSRFASQPEALVPLR